MAGINKVILIGYLGKDPEVKTLSNNQKLAKFSVATSESYKGKDGEWKDKTEWHNIICWRSTAERAEKSLKKGAQVYIEGKLRTSSYQDQDGNNRYVTEVEAEYFTILGARNNDGAAISTHTNGNSEANSEAIAAIESESDDNLPF